MNTQVLDGVPLWALYLLLILFLLGATELGYQLGRARLRRHGDEKEGNLGSMAAGTLGMFAFILAVLVGASGERFALRRQLVTDEANAIRTAYLRAGYLDSPYPAEIRPLLAEYVDVRLSALDPGQIDQAIARSQEIHIELWERTEALARANPSDVIALFVESANEVINLHTQRIRAVSVRIPPPLWLCIFLLAGLCMLMLGLHNAYSGQRSLLALVVLVLAFAAVIALLADLDRPTAGFLNVSQQALVDLQRFMSEYP